MSSRWEDNAACRGKPVTWWVPDDDQPPDPRARSLCDACPVAVDCLTVNVWFHDQVGLIGSVGPNGRKHLRRQLRNTDPAEHTELIAAAVAAARSAAPADVNSDGATCGHVATYGKNCRCLACRHAAAYHWRRQRPPIDLEPVMARPRRTCDHVDIGICNACRHLELRAAA